MRKLMWVTLGFGLSCALFAYLLPKTMLFWIAAAGAALFAVLMAIPGKRMLCRVMGLIALGCAMGTLWFSAFYGLYLNGAVAADGEIRTVRIHVRDYSYETNYGSAVDCDVMLSGKSYQAKAYLKENLVLEPGMEIAGDFRFRVTTPDGEETATYHQGRGTFLLLYQKGELAVSNGEPDWKDRVAVLRKAIKSILEKAFPEDVYGFAKALLLGDTHDLGYEVDTELKISGIRHVVSVSGLHVSILFALLSTLTLKNRFLTGILVFPALLVFAALAGFTPSVTRACWMLSLTLLGLLMDKNYDGPTALSFAVLMMLIINPLTVTDVGFQLSVGSVAGIYAFAAPISAWVKGNRKGRLISWLSGSVGTTLSAMTITTPLCAFYFGTVSLVSVITNLLTLWVISAVFYGILAVCLLGTFWMGAARALAWVIAWPIRYVLAAAGILADIPLAAVYTKSGYMVCWLILAYLLLGLFWISRQKKPTQLICVCTMSLCFALLASWVGPMTEEVRFTMLDVGQGQSLILQSAGKTFLVDCGGDSDEAAADEAAATLLSQGITRLDGVIVTHADRDHAGGIRNLLGRIDTELLILPQDGGYLNDCTEGQTVYPDRDMKLSFGNAEITVFVPRYIGTGNENSLCILFETEKCAILITGDRNGFGERSLLRYANLPDVDVLVAGHHGSRNSTCQELLDAVKPEIVCISASADNSFGHPSRETLQRLCDAGCDVYRTDLNGEIVIRR